MLTFIKSIVGFSKTIILSLLLVCLVIFMVNNRQILTIHLYPLPFEIETRVFLVMIGFFIFGLLFGILICSKNIISRIIGSFKDQRKIKKLEKRVAKKI